jgi:uncharacterized protein (TIGR04255 family)
MARVRHLSKAPITEALFDLRAALPDDFPLDRLKDVRDRMVEKYPTVEEQRFFAAKLTFQPSRELTPETTELSVRGYSFKSGDGLTIAQFRRDGFTLNRLKPYTRWAELLPEARALWRLYAEVTGIHEFTRVATRFINHLKVPAAPTPAFDRYLTSAPATPGGAPPSRVGFLSRVESRDPATGLHAIVTQATEAAPEPGMLTIILDIDVYELGAYGPEDPTLDALFEALHQMKNHIFFSAITEATAEEHE